MPWIIIIILLVILVAASVPAYPYSREWGYGPVGVLAAILLILLILWMLGVIDINLGGVSNGGGGGVPATRPSGPGTPRP